MPKSTGSWLVKFKGRNPSKEYIQNFLWNDGSIYIMDNHRAAMWCWLQHISIEKQYNLLHIDQHYDALDSRLDEWDENLPNDLYSLGIDAYMKLEYKSELGKIKIIRFDNYLALFLKRFGNLLNKCVFATRDYGRRPFFDKKRSVFLMDPKKLTDDLGKYLSDKSYPWILNLDLDYFFDEKKDSNKPIFDDEYIEAVLKVIAEQFKNGNICVLTVALSPECAGGWSEAERICALFCKTMNLGFKLDE